ncbi:unnamed protein product [Pleuronectes platessa]|uniref:Uncharacterized protein n=1 Tax=Pleuronectes platessa TaxID=8262 RepID=A0A9N7URX0_PLEPL|nr:unnamed protein product [Pleuronectes platessa]
MKCFECGEEGHLAGEGWSAAAGCRSYGRLPQLRLRPRQRQLRPPLPLTRSFRERRSLRLLWAEPRLQSLPLLWWRRGLLRLSNAKACKASRGLRSSQGSAPSSQEEVDGLYPPSDIRTFLETTKGQRLPSVEDHFPDLKLFLKSSKPLTRKTGSDEFLTDQQIYRLRKLVLRVKGQTITDDDEF